MVLILHNLDLSARTSIVILLQNMLIQSDTMYMWVNRATHKVNSHNTQHFIIKKGKDKIVLVHIMKALRGVGWGGGEGQN